MPDPRVDELRRALLEAGVAKRIVCRAVMEIESHFRQLVDDECKRGASADGARLKANDLLGTNEDLVRRYASQPELRTWARRYPAICFVLLPLIAYVGSCATILLALLAIADRMAPYLHRVQLTPEVTRAVDLAARLAFLGVFPLVVAAAVAVLAHRRRVDVRWPVAGILAISALASLANVGVKLTGGASPGEIGAGIGFSLQTLPGQLTRVVVLASLSMAPLWVAIRRQHRGTRML